MSLCTVRVSGQVTELKKEERAEENKQIMNEKRERWKVLFEQYINDCECVSFDMQFATCALNTLKIISL
jgi:hypothetical protein